jgi:hypothetical protein
MLLKAIIDDQEISLEVPDPLLGEGEAFFAKLDADMDQGWQMSREWVANPSQVERCQIVADKLLTALEKENQRLGILMAGYLLSRLPGLETVTLDTHGEMQNTHFTVAASPPTATPRPRGEDRARHPQPGGGRRLRPQPGAPGPRQIPGPGAGRQRHHPGLQGRQGLPLFRLRPRQQPMARRSPGRPGGRRRTPAPGRLQGPLRILAATAGLKPPGRADASPAR